MQELADTRAAAARDLEKAQHAAAAKCNALEAQLLNAERQLQERLGQMVKDHAQSVARSEVNSYRWRHCTLPRRQLPIT